MKIKPLRDRVLVKRVDAEEETAGGIVIPDTAKERPQRGEVVALGTGKTDEKGEAVPWEVKEGDRVLFGKYSGTDIEIEGEEYLFIREEDILATL